MGKPTGFVEWPRVPAPKREKAERLEDWRELHLALAPEEAKRQAGRCMDCGVPFCHQGCPLGNLIPDFNDAVYRGQWKEAYQVLSRTNTFPEFTGRLCPAPCEAACVLAIDRDAVTIEQLEKEISERAFAEGWVKARPPARRTGRRVAVVGSGPAGLAAASQLNAAGHTVTVYEKDPRAGGLLRYGIPDFKLEKSVLDRRLALMEAEGIVFRTGEDVGATTGYRALREQYDGVVLALGARRARELDVPGRELSGVLQAMEYLEHQNRVVTAGATPDARLEATGKRVIILGGGDTGSDCLGTALRQDAQSVMQVELLPAPPSVRAKENPWPRWPLVFRTSTSQEEGGERAFALLTKRLEGEDGQLKRLHAVRVEVQREPGGAMKLLEVPGSEQVFDVDLLVLAMGFTGPETGPLAEELGVKLSPRGTVQVDARFATSAPGVYCAGDASRGASLIVWALADGREAARALDTWLSGTASVLPTRGQDCAF
ncbi:glutamate synthase subunit beta [Corallococcus praedator]|uniref:Glutamate synthase subunit beta n=1 Tax=Corallococcus praedator TaxID=2316724 RepID=A0ABX9QF98_9BACT|nr:MULTISPECIES: glutamate synthase subunit beta [Corallococcus]RKH11559.1 glutamate synthase subunit beta [Corallococcus sp. CA047B]RKH26544.1 glutamate synthase subunit beta [Corallococcus sp. CA031C]RKI06301.1 glutamate synthase subunit beta [Corallococcus praedator]